MRCVLESTCAVNIPLPFRYQLLYIIKIKRGQKSSLSFIRLKSRSNMYGGEEHRFLKLDCVALGELLDLAAALVSSHITWG